MLTLVAAEVRVEDDRCELPALAHAGAVAQQETRAAAVGQEARVALASEPARFQLRG